MFPAFVQQVEAAGEMQVGFRRTGAIALLPENVAPSEYRSLSFAELQRFEPFVHSAGHSAFFVQKIASILSCSCGPRWQQPQNLGVEIRTHTEAVEIRRHGNGVQVVTQSATFSTTAAVDCREHGRRAGEAAQRTDALRLS